ncbi:efflux RND transporter periplasmic adaptor subunit [Cyanothece sp. BG0011]|uniref:efflux RND transporter periplasmic adaptor subunit n=1 Tax=Cyanothece sp. BG0011 TaxID=2082950 RepID=UPI0018E5A2CF|nr:efflux RND transporter periplasmic adaptor subunit [Cyanothece sp. BG0011]
MANNSLNQDSVLSTEKKKNVFSRGFFKDKQLILGIAMGMMITFGAIKLLPMLSTEESPTTATPITQSPKTPQTVTVTSVETYPLKHTLEATGTIVPVESIPIYSQKTGLQILEIFADEGEWINPGQTLVSLDNSVEQAQLQQAKARVAKHEARLAELRAGNRVEEIAQAKASVQQMEANLAQAEADLTLAQERVQRNQSLEAESVITRDRLDEVINEERIKRGTLEENQARLTEAKEKLAQLEAGPRRETIAQAVAELAEAKAEYQVRLAQLENTKIISPVRGKITKREAKLGDITTASRPLFTVIENGRLELQIKIPETQLTRIRRGQTVLITSDKDPTLKFQTKIREIEPLIDETSRQATLVVDLPSNPSLKPGMFLRGTIVTRISNTLSVPLESVLPQEDGSALVYLVKPDNTVEARRVETGEILSNQRIEILKGLREGETLVLKGTAYLKDGDPIVLPQ